MKKNYIIIVNRKGVKDWIVYNGTGLKEVKEITKLAEIAGGNPVVFEGKEIKI